MSAASGQHLPGVCALPQGRVARHALTRAGAVQDALPPRLHPRRRAPAGRVLLGWADEMHPVRFLGSPVSAHTYPAYVVSAARR